MWASFFSRFLLYFRPVCVVFSLCVFYFLFFLFFMVGQFFFFFGASCHQESPVLGYVDVESV